MNQFCRIYPIILFECFIFLLIQVVIILQKDNGSKTNIDIFTIILLLFTSLLNNPVNLVLAKTILKVLSFLFIILYFFHPLFLKPYMSINSFGNGLRLFIFGIIIGVILSMIKLLINNNLDLITNVLKYPRYFIFATFYSMSLSNIYEGIVYRGFLWFILRKFNFNTPLIILTSTIIWTFSNPYIWNNIPALLNMLFFGIILGISIWKTKSISMSIGIQSGYSIFLVLYSFIHNL